jgi:hypothetical protein
VADRLAHGAHVVGAVELGHHRLEGEGHVRARVAVGHRIHVEPVQLLLVRTESVAIAEHHLAQVRGIERLEHGHGEES